VEPGLGREDGDGEPKHPSIIEHGRWRRWVAGPGGPGPWRVGGRRGRPNLAGLAGKTTLTEGAARPRIWRCTAASGVAASFQPAAIPC
jgi:hypothetical protein